MDTQLAVRQDLSLDERTCECGCGLIVKPGRRFRPGHNIGIGGIDDRSRFLQFTQVGNGDECWEWQHTISNSGYGQIKVRRRMMQAHRFSYELHNGPIPEGLLLCHTCDNKRCVNPDHLFPGTHHDNAMDMVQKDRHARYRHVGEENPMAILSENDVKEIRKLRREGLTQRAIADKFDLCRAHVGDIVNRKIWVHVED